MKIESRRDGEQRMERMQVSVLSKIKKELEATSENLQKIHVSVSRKTTSLVERVSHLETVCFVDTKVNCLEKTVHKKVNKVEKTVNGKFVMI